MTITDNSSIDLVTFADASDGDIFKGEDNYLYVKIETLGGKNAINLLDGTSAVFSATDTIKSLNAELTIWNNAVS